MTKLEKLFQKKGLSMYKVAQDFQTSIPAMSYKISTKDHKASHEELISLAEYFDCDIEDLY